MFKKFFSCSFANSEHTGHTLKSYKYIVGLPPSLHSDNHNIFKESLFKRLLLKFRVYQNFTENHSPWLNWSEPAIGEVKLNYQKLMLHTNTPVHLCCFLLLAHCRYVIPFFLRAIWSTNTNRLLISNELYNRYLWVCTILMVSMVPFLWWKYISEAVMLVNRIMQWIWTIVILLHYISFRRVHSHIISGGD